MLLLWSLRLQWMVEFLRELNKGLVGEYWWQF